MDSLARLLVRIAAAVLACAACAPLPYAPPELDAGPAAGIERHAARTPADGTLTALVVASGYEGVWPPAVWTLEELTLLALHFNPAMNTARAEFEVARARLERARARPPVAISVAAEHHSRAQDGDGPWSLGLALQLPWVASDRRQARIERAERFAQSAELAVAESAWRVRAEVRDRLIDLWAANARLALLEDRLAARGEMLRLVRQRIDAGLLSARELAQEQSALLALETEEAAARAAAADATAGLATALGVPLSVVQAMRIGDEPDGEARMPEALRPLALRNRIDLQRALIDYGVADAELKLAVASQYPDISLSPGYLWDQGDRVWSLVTGFAFPAGSDGHAAVREAQARREVAARRFEALQLGTLADTERALSNHARAADRTAAAARRLAAARAEYARAGKLFEAGAADRFELTAARVVMLGAESERREAGLARLRALAALEDTLQHPLLGDFRRLPGAAVAGAGWNR